MTRLTTLASAAAVSVALMTAASPAMAQEYPNPEGGSSGDRTPAAIVQDEGLDATSVALGALAGIALGGTGLAITLGVQRRRYQAALPIAWTAHRPTKETVG
ncbi:hypothetical protein [Kribbella steppae]|nr:hypothetical protein [Kribbella steppae]